MSKIMRNGVEFTGGASAWSGTQAEYDALPIKDSTTLYFITDADGDRHIYSTDERVVGTWIDGSTIYEKTFSVTSGITTGVTAYPHNISNLGKIVSILGNWVRADGKFGGIPSVSSSVDSVIGVASVDSTNYSIFIGSNYQLQSAITSFTVTLRYIKTST